MCFPRTAVKLAQTDLEIINKIHIKMPLDKIRSLISVNSPFSLNMNEFSCVCFLRNKRNKVNFAGSQCFWS